MNSATVRTCSSAACSPAWSPACSRWSSPTSSASRASTPRSPSRRPHSPLSTATRRTRQPRRAVHGRPGHRRAGLRGRVRRHRRARVLLRARPHRPVRAAGHGRAAAVRCALLAVYLVPFLKYPANPPAVGDPDTLGKRTTLYFLMMLLSVLLAVGAVILGKRLAPRLGNWYATVAAAAVFAWSSASRTPSCRRSQRGAGGLLREPAVAVPAGAPWPSRRRCGPRSAWSSG